MEQLQWPANKVAGHCIAAHQPLLQAQVPQAQLLQPQVAVLFAGWVAAWQPQVQAAPRQLVHWQVVELLLVCMEFSRSFRGAGGIAGE